MDKDIFIARTGASTGENVYVVNPPDAVFASYLIRLQYENNGIGRLVGEFLRTKRYSTYVANSLGGSAQPNANAKTLSAVLTVFPPAVVAEKYYEHVRSMDLRRKDNNDSSSQFATLRDTLLPKLISGELRIKDAEKFLKDAPL